MIFALLAVSSNKSVANEMSWAEFHVVFSWMGIAGLMLGVVHQGLWGAIILKHRPNPSTWNGNGVLVSIFRFSAVCTGSFLVLDSSFF